MRSISAEARPTISAPCRDSSRADWALAAVSSAFSATWLMPMFISSMACMAASAALRCWPEPPATLFASRIRVSAASATWPELKQILPTMPWKLSIRSLKAFAVSIVARLPASGERRDRSPSPRVDWMVRRSSDKGSSSRALRTRKGTMAAARPATT
jgi:hypothetical protein